MALTYPTLGTVAPGDVLRANSGTAAYNDVIKSVNQHRKPPMCRVVSSSGVATTNGGWGIGATSDWSVSIDTDPTMYTVANRQILINTAGVYLITFGGVWAANATGDRLVSISLNDTSTGAPTSGKIIVSSYTKAITASDTSSTGAAMLSLAVGDTLRMHIYQNSGGNLTFGTAGGGYPFYSAAWIGQVS